MSDYNKPIIVISKCLGFDNCKYDGSIENNEFIEKLKKYVKVIPICPEIECGLQIHHSKLRIVENNNKEELLIPNEDLNLTQEMHDFSNKFLNKLTNVDGFILKSKSPICALKDAKVYDTLEKGCAIKREHGFFTKEIIKQYPYIPIEDEHRLNNFKIREHFLSRIFILSDFRLIKKSFNFESLKSFHLKNTLLFLSYSQKHSKLLDNLIYSDKIEDINILFKEYEFYLNRLLEKAPRYTSNINVLMKSLEQFGDKISTEELQFLWTTIDKYKNGYIPFTVPLYLVKSYVVRFELYNLLDQSFFMPYPEDLIILND